MNRTVVSPYTNIITFGQDRLVLGSVIYVIGRVKAYPAMRHLGFHRDTQAMIAYINSSLTEYY